MAEGILRPRSTGQNKAGPFPLGFLTVKEAPASPGHRGRSAWFAGLVPQLRCNQKHTPLLGCLSRSQPPEGGCIHTLTHTEDPLHAFVAGIGSLDLSSGNLAADWLSNLFRVRRHERIHTQDA